MMKTQKIILSSLIYIFSTSCVELKYRYNDENKAAKAKSEQTNETTATNNNRYTQSLEFIQRHRDPQLGVDEADERFIRSLQPTFAGSAEEAATALYYLKKSITEPNTELEDITTKDRFDFLTVLGNNQILASHQLSALSLLAIKRSTNPQSSFNQQIQKTIDDRVNFWSRISKHTNQNQETSNSVPVSNAVNIVNEPISPTLTEEVIESGDEEALFLSGEEDFQSERYKEATQKLEKISESSKFYARSRQILKTISNKMVSNLRNKAASSYQNSLPVTEPNLKRTYLNEAKKYLEEAVNIYKYSDENALIKDNLAVINRELDAIRNY